MIAEDLTLFHQNQIKDLQAQLAVANEENRLLLLERDQLKDNYEKTKVMLSNAEQRLRKQSAELWVAKDSQLRTYDGLADRADKYEKLIAFFNQLEDRK